MWAVQAQMECQVSQMSYLHCHYYTRIKIEVKLLLVDTRLPEPNDVDLCVIVNNIYHNNGVIAIKWLHLLTARHL